MKLKFCAAILQNENMDAAYVEVPYDIKELFGKGRLLVNATFDGVPYRGQVVKMGGPGYIIGVTKQIRKQIGKSFGDIVEVVLQERRMDKMDQIWNEMYQAAKAVQNSREISDYVEAGGVAAAILSSSGKIYTGVCIDTCSTLGICAERNAIFHMITNGEQEIKKVLAIMPDGKTGAPCGACRELMVQLMPDHYREVEILLDYEAGKVVTLGELTPEWWIG